MYIRRTVNQILVIGCASSDTLHIGGQTFHAAGGAGLYTALAASCTGARVTLFAPRPEPMPVEFVSVTEHVAWMGPLISSEKLPRLEIAHHGDGKATLISASWGAESQLSPDDLASDLSEFGCVHVAALSSAQRMLDFVRACRQRNAKRISAGTYAHVCKVEPATVRAIFEQADCFFMNENEATMLWGSLHVASGVAKRTGNDGLLFITFDKRGAIVIENGDRATPIEAYPSDELDPTGAGDAFCGATLGGLTNGYSTIDAARNGAWLAARTIEQIGAAFLLREKSRQLHV
jgi:sugar/nucleoside kinase (ribokinase family)